jgi:hypothetical protein
MLSLTQTWLCLGLKGFVIVIVFLHFVLLISIMKATSLNVLLFNLFKVREPFSIMSLLKSPMGLMVGFMVLMVFVMPKMMENIGIFHLFYIEWIQAFSYYVSLKLATSKQQLLRAVLHDTMVEFSSIY